MAVYLIADIDVLDGAAFAPYREQVPALIAAHGGRYLARGGAIRVLEGGWNPKRCTVIEFSSMAALDAFWAAPEYQPLRELRLRTTRSNIIVTEGL
jgi:uncharacterized protein (DUF1330 family)